MNWRVPLFDTEFGSAELEAVQKPVRTGWLTMGEITAEFEAEFSRRCGVKHAMAVSNCTAALHLSAVAAELGAGDEVICPTLTFVASANAIRCVGATPIFCESAGPHNLNAGPEQVAEKITSRTKAIMVVHYAGFPVDLPAMLELAGAHDLVLLEDCAHALFSTLRGRTCGSWGLCGAFSFFGNKNITCGEGGMVTTNDDELAARVRWLRTHGMTTNTLDRYKGRAFSYDVVEHGYNYRLDEIRSNLALAQLARLDHFLAQRERVRRSYCEKLADGEVTVPHFDWDVLRRPGDRVAYHIMPVILPEDCDRSAVVKALKQAGIQSSLHYRPVHTMSAYAGTERQTELPVRTEALAARQLTLPFYPTMSEEQVALVCETLLAAVAGHAPPAAKAPP